MGRILVTGATGSLGTNVIAEAVRRGLEVRALVREPARLRGFDGVELVQGDALDPATVTRALEGRAVSGSEHPFQGTCGQSCKPGRLSARVV